MVGGYLQVLCVALGQYVLYAFAPAWRFVIQLKLSLVCMNMSIFK